MNKIVPLFVLGFWGLSCGGDEPPPPKPAAARSTAKKAKPKKANLKSGETGGGYEKIPDDMRQKFNQRDFEADSSGDERRDPFRSLFFSANLNDGGASLRKTDACSERGVRWEANGYSVRDLNLVGVVKTGRSYAQYVDRSEKDSWVVRRGDCLGQEKAVVEEIGIGYVNLTITPEAAPNSPVPATQEITMKLFTDDLNAQKAVDGAEN